MRRKHYAIIYSAGFLILLTVGLLQRATGVSLSILIYLTVAALIPSSVRRLHDIGYSGSGSV
jgi:hypothetical protein